MERYTRTNKKKDGEFISISDKAYFKVRNISRNRDISWWKGHSKKEYKAILNLHTFNNRASKYIKQKLTELEVKQTKTLSGFACKLSQ